MKVRGETIGTLDAESPVQGAYDGDDLELLEVFASHAAAAIHNARMFQKVEDANETLRANIQEMERLNRELDSTRHARANDALERQVKHSSRCTAPARRSPRVSTWTRRCSTS